MALTNFILTVAGVSAVVLLLRSDVKQSATIFRRNVRQIRSWLEEESASAAKYAPIIALFSTNFIHAVFVRIRLLLWSLYCVIWGVWLKISCLFFNRLLNWMKGNKFEYIWILIILNVLFLVLIQCDADWIFWPIFWESDADFIDYHKFAYFIVHIKQLWWTAAWYSGIEGVRIGWGI